MKMREIVSYLIIIVLVFLLLKEGLSCGPHISLPSVDEYPAEPDTIYLDVPPLIIDSVVEKIVYIETSPDTVQIIIYKDTPVTLDFVRATISDDGWAEIEILQNDSVAVVLEGQVEYYGDTHIQVNPDSTISFINRRMGCAVGISAGITTIGPDAYVETLYFNDLLGTNTTLHFPNIGYERDVWGPNEGANYVTITGSVDLDPWHSPLRVHGGAKLDFDNPWPPGFTAGVETMLFSF